MTPSINTPLKIDISLSTDVPLYSLKSVEMYSFGSPPQTKYLLEVGGQSLTCALGVFGTELRSGTGTKICPLKSMYIPF